MERDGGLGSSSFLKSIHLSEARDSDAFVLCRCGDTFVEAKPDSPDCLDMPGKWPNLPMEPVDLAVLVKGILETYPNLESQNAEICIMGPLPTVLGNEAMLMQVLSNLLGNAVKFARAGIKPQIKIWAETRPPLVRLLVKDEGIGIAPDQHQKIFNIFQQVEKIEDGTGIGLAIVKKSVERMNGNVGVDSTLGHGSTFWIELKPA